MNTDKNYYIVNVCLGRVWEVLCRTERPGFDFQQCNDPVLPSTLPIAFLTKQEADGVALYFQRQLGNVIEVHCIGEKA